MSPEDPRPAGDDLDREAVARIESLGGGELVSQIFGLVLEQGPARVVGAWDGYRRGDLPAVRLAAHSLCSSAGNVGAMRLLALAREVEALAVAPTMAEIPTGEMETALGALEDEWGRIQGLLEAWREQPVKRRLALVEDNFENRLLARLILTPFYEVAEYETGGAALAAFAEAVPELVLLDLSLPDMDGTEMLALVRASPRLCRLPVVAFTAYASAEERGRFLAQGFDGYIAKPITDKSAMLAQLAGLFPAAVGAAAD